MVTSKLAKDVLQVTMTHSFTYIDKDNMDKDPELEFGLNYLGQDRIELGSLHWNHDGSMYKGMGWLVDTIFHEIQHSRTPRLGEGVTFENLHNVQQDIFHSYWGTKWR